MAAPMLEIEAVHRGAVRRIPLGPRGPAARHRRRGGVPVLAGRGARDGRGPAGRRRLDRGRAGAAALGARRSGGWTARRRMREHEDAVAADDALRQGREAYARRAWPDARNALLRTDAAHGLEPADLELLATCAYMLGHDDEVVDGLTRAHHAHAQRGEQPAAARCAFWLGLLLMPRRRDARDGVDRARAADAGGPRTSRASRTAGCCCRCSCGHVASEEWAAAGAVAARRRASPRASATPTCWPSPATRRAFALIRQGRVAGRPGAASTRPWSLSSPASSRPSSPASSTAACWRAATSSASCGARRRGRTR